jgi:uncharacterized membrane-anchored protein
MEPVLHLTRVSYRLMMVNILVCSTASTAIDPAQAQEKLQHKQLGYCDDVSQTLCEGPIIYFKVFHRYIRVLAFRHQNHPLRS